MQHTQTNRIGKYTDGVHGVQDMLAMLPVLLGPVEARVMGSLGAGHAARAAYAAWAC